MNEKEISSAIQRLNRMSTMLGYPINPFELEKVLEENGLKISGDWFSDMDGKGWFQEDRHMGFFNPSGELGYYFWAWLVSGEVSYLTPLHKLYVDWLNAKYASHLKAIDETKQIANAPREPEVGYIYVFKSEGLYKIGRAKDPKSRIKYYMTANSTKPEFELCIKVGDYITAELDLHKHFSKKNTEREWFKLTAKDLKFIENYLKERAAQNED